MRVQACFLSLLVLALASEGESRKFSFFCAFASDFYAFERRPSVLGIFYFRLFLLLIVVVGGSFF